MKKIYILSLCVIRSLFAAKCDAGEVQVDGS